MSTTSLPAVLRLLDGARGPQVPGAAARVASRRRTRAAGGRADEAEGEQAEGGAHGAHPAMARPSSATGRASAPGRPRYGAVPTMASICSGSRGASFVRFSWPVSVHEDVVLDADADALVPLGDAGGVGREVEPRLHREDHPRLEHAAASRARRSTRPRRGRRCRASGRCCACTRGGTSSPRSPSRAVPVRIPRSSIPCVRTSTAFSCIAVQGSPGFTQGDHLLLRAQHEVVDLALGRP